jgi:hypothetical protein
MERQREFPFVSNGSLLEFDGDNLVHGGWKQEHLKLHGRVLAAVSCCLNCFARLHQIL